MTAAHRTLPFQTRVRVLNLDNQRSTVVRITDRGPFVKGRIIDLSLAAARKIGLVETGTARVKLTVLGSAPSTPPAPAPQGHFFVQLGSFREVPNAQRMLEKLKRKFPGETLKIKQFQGLQRVWAGPWTTRARAEEQLSQFSRSGYNGFVLRQ